MNEHISFIANSYVAAIFVGMAVAGAGAMLWFLLRALMVFFCKTGVALRAWKRWLQLSGQRIKNFPGSAASIFIEEAFDAWWSKQP